MLFWRWLRGRKGMQLSKTNFLIYRDCAHNAWVKMHRPEVYRAKPLSAFDQNIIDTGNAIDVLARDLFPDGIEVQRSEFNKTKDLISARTPVIYQAAVATDRFVIACDILVWNASTQRYDLYEVKGSTSGGDTKANDELYTYDIGFQVVVLQACNVPLGRHYVVRLNSEYLRNGELDLNALFTREDFTERVSAVLSDLPPAMKSAFDVLQSTKPLPSPCACIYKGRSAHCTTFEFSNPNVPAYSVHDIARIGSSKARLHELIDRGMLAITDVPDEIALSDKQMSQIRAAKTGRAESDTAAIRAQLNSYQFPLAFFDYETYPAGVPRFAGYRPFDQIPFQFSLDVIDDVDAPVRHHEFLFTETTCPDVAMIEALRQHLPKTGSIVTWSKKFEIGINQRLAARNPTAASFLADLNARVVDLMEVFASQAYIHPGFKGSSSIKAVLPVLVPSLSYKELIIQEGGTASDAWNKLVTGRYSPAEIADQRRALLAYCGLDTRAMWEIWKAISLSTGDETATGRNASTVHQPVLAQL